nr:DUF4352 domain-containing protein [Actinopolymorpha rutila]
MGIGCLAILGAVFGLVLIIGVGAALSGGGDDAAATDQTDTTVDESADKPAAADTKKADTEKADTEKADTEKADTEKADTEKADTEKADTEKAKSEKAAPAKKVDDTAGIGDAVRDGDFTFTVTKVTKGPARIGNEYLNTKPQGKFVYVYLTVENHGKEAGTFLGDDQYLFDTQGRKASADSEAAVYLDDSQSLLEEINPGNKLSGIVVFDIPTDATPASLELHDSMFSGGVKVAVK